MSPTPAASLSTLTSRFVLAGLAAILLVPAAAQAGDEDDVNFVRIGYQRVVIHDQNDGFTGPGIPLGAGLQTQTEDFNALTFGYGRAVSEHGEISLILGIPPTFHVHARGPASVGAVPYNGQPLSSGKEFAPSIAYYYKFNDPGALFRPYLGIGLVYSHFYDIQVTPQADAINGGPTSITYNDSIGLRWTAGVALKLVDHVYGSFSVSRADVMPSVVSDTLGVKRYNNYDLNPTVWAAQLTYGF